jgi:acyl-CoA reductase-like NAD-dependent aldehyde dehydrogenase
VSSSPSFAIRLVERCVCLLIPARAVHINAMSVHDEPNLPHGGAKSSGFGRFNSRWGLEEFLRTKTITYQD